MSVTLTRFRIEALHGIRTIDVPITENKLVLVGENGTGKSTVSNFIYFLLTYQWHRMLQYEFNSVSAIIDSKDITVTREEIVIASRAEFESREAHLIRRFPGALRRRLQEMLLSYSHDELLNNEELFVQLRNQYGVSFSAIRDFLAQLDSEDLPLFSYKLKEVGQTLKSLITGQILYLPTYRRIEQDLRSIFPGLEEIRPSRERLTRKGKDSSYIELVEFGMEDVEETIKSKMGEIKDNVRNGLNDLTGIYLRDVIRRDYQSIDPSKIIELDDPTIDEIFNRIDVKILPKYEQSMLRDVITKIKSEGSIQEDDKVVAHFLTRLIELYRTQQENEKDVREFVRVCNGYLSSDEKKLDYDNLNYDISIRQRGDITKKRKDTGSEKITMKMLSSGEKQIVSLFSHIYLSGGSNYFVIIDEPELSLSVPWQKRFLPDILATDRCSGLVAVTHSPFIFDNQLDHYTHSIEEFTEPVNVVS